MAWLMITTFCQTDVGKVIVRRHEPSVDAQKAYSDLLHEANNSTSATLLIEQHTDWITTKKMDERWTGTAVGFLVTWQEKLRLLETLTPLTEHYPETAKKRMLEAAVSPSPELRAVKAIDEQRIATGDSALSFSAYVALLQSAAQRRDQSLSQYSSRARSRRSINAHSIGEYPIDSLG